MTEQDTEERTTDMLLPGAEDLNKRVGQYVQIRDALKALKEKQDEERKPLESILETLAGVIRSTMENNGITDSIKTKLGTAYLSTKYTASVADAEAFMKFVQEGNFDIIERRANATVVKAYVKKHNQLPPGVNLSAVQSVGVRRPGAKKD